MTDIKGKVIIAALAFTFIVTAAYLYKDKFIFSIANAATLSKISPINVRKVELAMYFGADSKAEFYGTSALKQSTFANNRQLFKALLYAVELSDVEKKELCELSLQKAKADFAIEVCKILGQTKNTS
jgi:hypothetical protein